ncbi:hypothetical protein GCWU000325_00224 [Alloprevotella tannerae ATCC 51259]|uniref:Uncharacterized protein n=1 Tax=Alloprevotella tannerae ATCC 51259 TaxID=626522 RepID=C9LDF4_9BACT|nr:hypothetical protein GCWU000325_00224 [Alloprevotella tannerae ATCC 51259]
MSSIVCRQQTIVCSRQTMVCRDQTMVWWGQTIIQSTFEFQKHFFLPAVSGFAIHNWRDPLPEFATS